MKKFIQLMQLTTFGRFLLPLGIILLIFGIASMGVKDARNYIKVSAVVSRAELVQEAYTDSDSTHHDAEYEIHVKYTVAGREYESELGILSDVKVGDQMNVYYNPADPSEVVQMRNQAIIPYIFVGVGALALIGGILNLIKAAQKLKRMQEQEAEWS
ncbi:MAG: DUF3592 domain-containing protein [Firmicutes bacterium]|nr:DUF3592 domain-containing protein [Bacillota bacterium]